MLAEGSLLVALPACSHSKLQVNVPSIYCVHAHVACMLIFATQHARARTCGLPGTRYSIIEYMDKEKEKVFVLLHLLLTPQADNFPCSTPVLAYVPLGFELTSR